MNAVFKINVDGETTARGTLLIHRAETNATKVFHATSGDGTSASCEDTDGDEEIGLAFLAGRFVANDGEELDLSFTPTSGDIDEPGAYGGGVIITDGSGTVREFDGAILVVSAADGPMPRG